MGSGVVIGGVEIGCGGVAGGIMGVDALTGVLGAS